MNSKNIILFVVLCVVITAIVLVMRKYKPIELEKTQYALIKETQKEFELNSSPTFKGYYYQGSDEFYHYFISKWTISKDRYFKLSIKDLNITNTFYLFKKKEIRVYPFSRENSEIFGKTKHYTLYK